MTHIPHLVVSNAIREQQKDHSDTDSPMITRGKGGIRTSKQKRKHRSKIKVKRQNWFVRLFS